MKILGILLINFTFSSIGIIAVFRMKERETICDELILMARIIRTELSFSSSNYISILESLNRENALSHLSFLNSFNPESQEIITNLSNEENTRIEHIFSLLGTVDISSMNAELSAFEAYFDNRKEEYHQKLKSHSKLYVVSGFLGGAAVSILLM